MNLLHEDVTEGILKAYFHVYKTLGYGFLERVYEKSLLISLSKAGFRVARQLPVEVYFEGEKVGLYFADLAVDGQVIVEVKAASALAPEHEAQLLNYLKATDVEVGMLLNFGIKPEYRRKIFTNDRKLR